MTVCPIAGCSATIEWPLPLCQRHWYRVPHALRTALWSASRHGWKSAEYQDSCKAAIAAVTSSAAALEAPK